MVYTNPVCVLIRRGDCDTKRDLKDVHTQRKNYVKTQLESVICKPGREASGETKPIDTLILHFQPPEKKISVVKPHSLRYFAMATLAN